MYPENPQQSPSPIYLDAHYISSLRLMHIAPETLPDSVFFTFCGDILGSSGAHYAKGTPQPFGFYARKASTVFSDDVMESLAMVEMAHDDIPLPPEGLMAGRDRFFRLIRAHFERLSQTYSPWAKALFEAASVPAYLNILYGHSSCGAAMRAPVMAALALSPERALPLMLVTHGHVEAIEGGFYIYGFARAAMEGADFAACRAHAEEFALWGRRTTQSWQEDSDLAPQSPPPIAEQVARVLESGDPYTNIADIAAEGIETHFVVSSVMLALRDFFDATPDPDVLPPESAPAGIVERAMAIGGDPDTICSIGLSLYGLRWPEEAAAVLGRVRIGG